MNVFLKFSNSSSVIFTEYWNKVAFSTDLKVRKLLIIKTFSVAGIIAEQVLQAKQILQAAAWLKKYHCCYDLSQYVKQHNFPISLSNVIVVTIICSYNLSDYINLWKNYITLVIKSNCCGRWQILQSAVSRPINQCCHSFYIISTLRQLPNRLLVHLSLIYLRLFFLLLSVFKWIRLIVQKYILSFAP